MGAVFVMGMATFLTSEPGRDGVGVVLSYEEQLFSILTAEVLQPLWTGIPCARWAPHCSALAFAAPLPPLQQLLCWPLWLVSAWGLISSEYVSHTVVHSQACQQCQGLGLPLKPFWEAAMQNKAGLSPLTVLWPLISTCKITEKEAFGTLIATAGILTLQDDCKWPTAACDLAMAQQALDLSGLASPSASQGTGASHPAQHRQARYGTVACSSWHVGPDFVSFSLALPFYLCPACIVAAAGGSAPFHYFCSFSLGYDCHLIQFVFIPPWPLQLGWPGPRIHVLGTSGSLFWCLCERHSMDWVLLPDCRVWGHTCLGHCFYLLCLVASLIKSFWACGVDYQLVSDLVTGSYSVSPCSSHGTDLKVLFHVTQSGLHRFSVLLSPMCVQVDVCTCTM